MTDLESYRKELMALREELRVTERLLEERQRVLDAVPECPEHGACVPYAVQWIKNARTKLAEAQPVP